MVRKKNKGSGKGDSASQDATAASPRGAWKTKPEPKDEPKEEPKAEPVQAESKAMSQEAAAEPSGYSAAEQPRAPPPRAAAEPEPLQGKAEAAVQEVAVEEVAGNEKATPPKVRPAAAPEIQAPPSGKAVTTMALAKPESDSEDDMPPMNFTPGLIEDGPKLYKVSQNLFFKKETRSPEYGQIKKSIRPSGSLVYCTGKRWRGARGGVWAELDPLKDSGWVLVRGPGFGLAGPALVDAMAFGGTSIVLKFKHPAKVLKRPLVELLFRKEAKIREVRAKLTKLTGLKYHHIILANGYPHASPNGQGNLGMDYLPSANILQDDGTVGECGLRDGDDMPWTYLGNLNEELDLRLIYPEAQDE